MVTSRRYAKECGVLDRIGSIVEGGEILVDQQLQKKHLNSIEIDLKSKNPQNAGTLIAEQRGARASRGHDRTVRAYP
jgi:ribosomal protein L27